MAKRIYQMDYEEGLDRLDSSSPGVDTSAFRNNPYIDVPIGSSREGDLTVSEISAMIPGVMANKSPEEMRKIATEYRGYKEEFKWLPDDAFDVYYQAYIETGDAGRAWVKMRQDKRYDTWFPGNLTEDGRPRYNEALYANVVAQYDSVMESVGLGSTFQHRYGEWIAGDVTPDEAEARIVPMYERITSQSQALKSWYATNYGLEMTDRALLASALDPDLGEQVLTKQISIAEIGGEATESGFDVNKAFAERMYEEGQLNRSEAEAMFQRAETFVPVLSVLAARHSDPDDDFDLNEFVAADLFADPEQQRRMRRLMAQERSTFTGGRQVDYVNSDKTSGISGLDELR